jgi:hypothetical protein
LREYTLAPVHSNPIPAKAIKKMPIKSKTVIIAEAEIRKNQRTEHRLPPV